MTPKFKVGERYKLRYVNIVGAGKWHWLITVVEVSKLSIRLDFFRIESGEYYTQETHNLRDFENGKTEVEILTPLEHLL